MSRVSPNGLRRRYARALALALVFGGLCITLVGCGDAAIKMEAPGSITPSDFNAMKAEQYGAIVENEFRSPLVEPRSTFSADVNTASYSNVRRFIEQQNTLPPKDAVLLAELVNYFPYRYPAPTGDNLVSLTLDIAPCPWKPEHKVARIGVRAKDIATADMPPRNLVFLIDTSGSMQQDNRLPLVKRSLEMLIDQLTAKDTVTI